MIRAAARASTLPGLGESPGVCAALQPAADLLRRQRIGAREEPRLQSWWLTGGPHGAQHRHVHGGAQQQPVPVEQSVRLGQRGEGSCDRVDQQGGEPLVLALDTGGANPGQRGLGAEGEGSVHRGIGGGAPASDGDAPEAGDVRRRTRRTERADWSTVSHAKGAAEPWSFISSSSSSLWGSSSPGARCSGPCALLPARPSPPPAPPPPAPGPDRSWSGGARERGLKVAVNGSGELKQTKKRLHDQREEERGGQDLQKARADVERSASQQLEVVRSELAGALAEVSRLNRGRGLPHLEARRPAAGRPAGPGGADASATCGRDHPPLPRALRHRPGEDGAAGDLANRERTRAQELGSEVRRLKGRGETRPASTPSSRVSSTCSRTSSRPWRRAEPDAAGADLLKRPAGSGRRAAWSPSAPSCPPRRPRPATRSVEERSAAGRRARPAHPAAGSSPSRARPGRGRGGEGRLTGTPPRAGRPGCR